jgi:hypothetical protein
MSRDITKPPAEAGRDQLFEADPAETHRQSVLESLFDVRAYDEDATANPAPIPSTYRAPAVTASPSNGAAKSGALAPQEEAIVIGPPAGSGASTSHPSTRPEAWPETAAIDEDEDQTLPIIASMPAPREAPTGTRFRSAVHQVASASAALALAAIVAGIGSAAVDAFNALKIDAGSVAHATVEAPTALAATAGLPLSSPQDRLSFVRSAAFAAAIDHGQASATVAMQSPARAPIAGTQFAEQALITQRNFAAPQAFEQKVVQVQPVAAVSPTPPAHASVKVLNAQAPNPEPARASNMDQIASLIERTEPAAPQPVPALRNEVQTAQAVPVQQPRDATAQALPEAGAAALSPWDTKVVATARGKRLQDEVAAADRAQQMRRNAYALGVKPVPSEADAAGPAASAPATKPADTTPWYLRSPSWSPFNRADAQSR